MILAMICEREPIEATPSVFAIELDVTPTSIRRYTQPLAEKGYIKRHAGFASDMRLVSFEPTAEGKALMDRITRAMDAA